MCQAIEFQSAACRVAHNGNLCFSISAFRDFSLSRPLVPEQLFVVRLLVGRTKASACRVIYIKRDFLEISHQEWSSTLARRGKTPHLACKLVLIIINAVIKWLGKVFRLQFVDANFYCWCRASFALDSSRERDSSQHHPDFKECREGEKIVNLFAIRCQEKRPAERRKGEFPRTPSLVIIIPTETKRFSHPCQMKLRMQTNGETTDEKWRLKIGN